MASPVPSADACLEFNYPAAGAGHEIHPFYVIYHTVPSIKTMRCEYSCEVEYLLTIMKSSSLGA